MDPSEAVEYVRRDAHDARLAELEQERDALAAHVETSVALNQEGFDNAKDADFNWTNWNRRMREFITEAPAASLVRRDALKKKEALEALLNIIPGDADSDGCDYGCGKEAAMLRDHYKRLSEAHQ